MLLTVILISIALIANRSNMLFYEGILQSINIGAWAIAGACLSIILRSGHLQHASYAGKYLHFVESGCRLTGGFITGQIVLLGIKSGIIFQSGSGSELPVHYSSSGVVGWCKRAICAIHHHPSRGCRCN